METQSPFEEFRNIVVLSGKDIFFNIWTSPRKVFRYIADSEFDNFTVVLSFLMGVLISFKGIRALDPDRTSSLFGLLAPSIILGGLFGWVIYYIYAALLNWAGKWFYGKGNTNSIYRTIIFANIPTVFILAFFVLKISLFGIEAFKEIPDYSSLGEFGEFFHSASSLTESILNLWSLILLVIGIKEIQRYSYFEAILNLVFPFFVCAIPLFILIFLLFGISSF
ncbi:MAG: YIP1 family protein [Bacteroidetes bacterium]|nr:YIP1 family protein [Bacteroidota bacterium]